MDKEKDKKIDTLLSIDDFLAPSAIEITPNALQLGKRFTRTLFIATYPRYLNTNWFSPIVNFDRAFDISIFIHPQETGVVLKQLRDKLGRLEAQRIEEASSGKVSNPKLDTAVNDIELLRNKLQQGTDRFFEIGVYITIYENSTKELDETEARIKSFLDSQLIYSRQSTFRMKQGFQSTLPLDTDVLNDHISLNTEPASSLFPFVSYDLTSEEGILYGINTHNNSLILFDRFNLENANTVVFGKSGGGKSYAVKLEILRSLMIGTEVFIIDPENEYQYLSETVGGTNINISIGSDNHINPFDLPQAIQGEDNNDVLRSHILNLSGLIKLMLGDVTPEEESIIDEALHETYAIKDITPESDFSKIEPPLMSDFQNILQGMTGSDSLVVRLKKYTTGSFAGFLNNATDIQLDNRIVVFSIRDMEEELRPIAMYVVLNYIWTQVRKQLRKRILVVDEAWWLLKYDIGGSFLLNIAKRARKYFLGLTTISQDIPDFMNSPYGKPIISNSSLQILMKQSASSIDLVQETFNLTDAEKFFLLEARVGHGLFFAGTNHVGIRVVASYSEDQIITSDPRQILEIQAAKEEWNKKNAPANPTP
ncbi:MAG: conjugal transfer protein TraC [Candidatus Yanofskybacteria bacterium CG10_big_fil_rev_8_21_14_0_10_46_23]|uniref:Conjugal transfer protein TraC n=1 Tax=Candidatus Yanofskybacteria bacterium CG10_big_fil_rev_8_21_14_0_10_46_23 TaxID=1975098 RepID=A0A2H0R4A8_9BACT|nr:MAG: conjugal transfer protein TraC [Candidatus Yanofskybacteria bacterium CG10_big_fil_rev_8_21_14_0_10_46_23]